MKKKHKHKWKYQINVKKKVIVLVILGVSLFVGLGYALILSDFTLGGIIEYSKYEPPTITEEIISKASTGCVQKYIGNHQDSMDPSKSTEEIYYYNNDQNSGCIINNNVVFANRCWKIMRTTDTGGVKLLYNGDPTISFSNGRTQYYCGSERNQYHVSESIDDNNYPYFINFGSSYLFASDYTARQDQYTIFTLKDPITLTIDASNYEEQLENIAKNYPYTCKSETASECYYGSFQKIAGFKSLLSGNNAAYVYVYLPIYQEGVADTAYNINGIPGIGYMYGDEVEFGEKNLSYLMTIRSGKTLKLSKARDGLELIDPITVTYTEWINGFDTTYKDYIYTCGNTSSTCTENNLMHIYYKTTNSYSANSNHYYGKSVIYEDNKYKLQDISGLETLADREQLSTHHYTCLDTGQTECEKVAYIYGVGATGVSYILLDENVHSVQEALNIIFKSNTNDSIVKQTIETWYENKIKDTIFESKLEDTIYCNDRSSDTTSGYTYEESGWYPNGGGVKSNFYFRNNQNITDLSCPNDTDKFSVSNNAAKLKYPIALPTTPEIRLLNSNMGYRRGPAWTMSPHSFGFAADDSPIVKEQLFLNTYSLSIDDRSIYGWGGGGIGGVVSSPSISLKRNVKISKGDGSDSNPYVVAPDDGWFVVTDKYPMSQQKTEYWIGGHKIESGWRYDLTDFSGRPNTYYFENGYAKHGWLELDGKKYYLSTFDDDDNGYIDGRRLNGETREIDGVEYTFDENGVCTNCN